ncbi:MAG: hypothetical protein OXE87_12150 [Chloroflexi bacterium]|nr:hypothetical protein [Chloroflexota bacterium]
MPAARLGLQELLSHVAGRAFLAREYDDPTLLNGSLAANKFHENFFHDNMEDYEVEQNRPGVQYFVGQLLTLLDGE